MPPEGGWLSPEIQLFQLLVFELLVLDIFSDDDFIPANRRNEIPPGPKMLANVPTFALAIDSRQMDRALSLDVPDNLAHRIFRRYRQQHVYVVRHQMAFLNTAFALFGQLSKHRTEMSLQFAIQHLPSVFRDENDMVFAVPLGVT